MMSARRTAYEEARGLYLCLEELRVRRQGALTSCLEYYDKLRDSPVVGRLRHGWKLAQVVHKEFVMYR